VTTLTFELRLEAEADVVRACCGGNHEFGQCPANDKKEADDGTD
jgi:hypothetical protein